MKKIYLLASILVFVVITSCAQWKKYEARKPASLDGLSKSQLDAKVYNSLFQNYAQVCSLTQYVRRSGKTDDKGNEILDKGGSAGHATLFIKGACLDKSKSIPQLKICDDSIDLTHHDAGVGVSVNKIFHNVNWVAMDGRQTFFHGGLDEHEQLTNEAYEKVIMKAAKSGWYNGIIIDDEVLKKHLSRLKLSLEELKKPENRSLYDEVIARESVGTDFALSFARSALCTRIPLPKDRLVKMINFMNERNEESSKKGYAWDGIYDNCSHLTSNAFAATGIFDFKHTYSKPKNPFLNKAKSAGVVLKSGFQALFQQMPDMSIPANNVVRLAEAAFERDISDGFSVFNDKDNRHTLSGDKPWLPTSHGALLEFIHIKPADKNDMFVQGGDPIVLGDFFIKPIAKKFNKYQQYEDSENKRFYDLESNLEYYSKKYATILKYRSSYKKQHAKSLILTPIANISGREKNGDSFEKVYNNFYATVEGLNQDLHSKLITLDDINQENLDYNNEIGPE